VDGLNKRTSLAVRNDREARVSWLGWRPARGHKAALPAYIVPMGDGWAGSAPEKVAAGLPADKFHATELRKGRRGEVGI